MYLFLLLLTFSLLVSCHHHSILSFLHSTLSPAVLLFTSPLIYLMYQGVVHVTSTVQIHHRICWKKVSSVDIDSTTPPTLVHSNIRLHTISFQVNNIIHDKNQNQTTNSSGKDAIKIIYHLQTFFSFYITCSFNKFYWERETIKKRHSYLQQRQQ